MANHTPIPRTVTNPLNTPFHKSEIENIVFAIIVNNVSKEVVISKAVTRFANLGTTFLVLLKLVQSFQFVELPIRLALQLQNHQQFAHERWHFLTEPFEANPLQIEQSVLFFSGKTSCHFTESHIDRIVQSLSHPLFNAIKVC